MKKDNLKNEKQCVIHDVIGSVELNLIGKKGKELWYPTYAPHILFETGKSILTEIYIKHPELRDYR